MTEVVKVRQVGETLVITLTKGTLSLFAVNKGDRLVLDVDRDRVIVRRDGQPKKERARRE